jgi:hypothetical protein
MTMQCNNVYIKRINLSHKENKSPIIVITFYFVVAIKSVTLGE